jgi:hypothetical protein
VATMPEPAVMTKIWSHVWACHPVVQPRRDRGYTGDEIGPYDPGIGQGVGAVRKPRVRCWEDPAGCECRVSLDTAAPVRLQFPQAPTAPRRRHGRLSAATSRATPRRA